MSNQQAVRQDYLALLLSRKPAVGEPIWLFLGVFLDGSGLYGAGSYGLKIGKEKARNSR